MVVYFMDTSALGKRYMAEIGSAWIISLTLPVVSNRIVISDITEVEVFSAILRKLRAAQISAADAAQRQTDFILDLDLQYLTIPVNGSVRKQARGLIAKYPLRALDAIQLASAIEAVQQLAVGLIFVSADNALLNAAVAEGLLVDNPLLHP